MASVVSANVPASPVIVDYLSDLQRFFDTQGNGVNIQNNYTQNDFAQAVALYSYTLPNSTINVPISQAARIGLYSTTDSNKLHQKSIYAVT